MEQAHEESKITPDVADCAKEVVEMEGEVEVYQVLVDAFNDCSQSFTQFFCPNIEYQHSQFYTVLECLKACTNLVLRKKRREAFTVYECNCSYLNQENIKYLKGAKNLCKFNITVSELWDKIVMKSSHLNHTHIMFSKEDYEAMTYKQILPELETAIREEIENIIGCSLAQKRQDGEINMPRQHPSLCKEDLYIESLQPLKLLERLQKKYMESKSHVLTILTQNHPSQRKLMRQYTTLVDKVKKKILESAE